jgi:UDP-glucose 4-epimerase
MILINRTVLITGADGFIGSHLTEALVKEGAKVKALSCYNSFNSYGWLITKKFISETIFKRLFVFPGLTRNPVYSWIPDGVYPVL